ncbi:MAG: hypothetical protein KIT84_03760 [Labilithrix sp.]|nr:hypothetical protein [Labilithrix sp.]MCW5810100.1 hypothetical protein [Labilithrix sp.]
MSGAAAMVEPASSKRQRACVAVSERDVLDDIIRSMHASPDDAYWPRRLFDLVRDPVTAMRVRHHLVLAVQRFAAHDPAFFLHERYLSEQLAVWSWPREVLDALSERLVLDDLSLTHFVLGRLWLEARRPPEAMVEFYTHAARHLDEVAPEHRVGAWHESMCEALSVADPEELGQRAKAILGTVPEQSRERAVLAILRGAARIADWDLYDAHRAAYGGIVPSSEIARLDGLRAEDLLVGMTPVPHYPPPTPVATQPSPSSITEAKTIRPPSRI